LAIKSQAESMGRKQPDGDGAVIDTVFASWVSGLVRSYSDGVGLSGLIVKTLHL
jgi:hypothetical protein